MFRLLSQDEIETMHLASLEILSKVGARIEDESTLRLLQDSGADVDFNKELVRVPANLVEEGIRKAAKDIVLVGRRPKYRIELSKGKIYAHSCGGTLNFADAKTRRIRPSTTEDLNKLVRLADSLDNIYACLQVVFPGDAPPETKDIYALYSMINNTSKPLFVQTYHLKNLNYMIKMAEVVVGGQEELRKKPILVPYVSATSPLSFSEDVAQQLARCAHLGAPTELGPCPLSGGTSPVTLAGTVVLQNAEMLLSNLIIQLNSPNRPVIFAAYPSPIDMRTGNAAFGAVEAGLMNAAEAQLGWYYDIPSDVLALGTDSKTFDEQAACEKTLIASIVASAEASLLGATGSLESDITASLEQLYIDSEIVSMILRGLDGIEVNSETLALDVISDVGPGKHFLAHEHTRKYYVKEHYLTRFFDRQSRDAWEKRGAKNILEVATEKVNQILKEHEPLPLDSDIQNELKRLLKQADKELVKK